MSQVKKIETLVCDVGVMWLNLGNKRVLKNSKNQIVGFREEVRSDEEQRERDMSWGSFVEMSV